MSLSAPPLLLFDIDGTLMRKAGPHHRQVLVDAVKHVTGLATATEQIPVQGMLDRDILAWMLRDAGASATFIKRVMPGVVQHAQALYTECCPDLRQKVCPGVRPLLRRITLRGLKAGLVTGNLSAIGWKKVESAGLKSHFSFGAFAEQGKDRATLAARAIAQARRNKWITRHSVIVLFGDHENDILAAKANGIRSVAVATGLSQPAALSRLQPDFLLPDLRNCPLEEILS
ncbi:MAG: HAD hydrolase-like protein [Acidobacteria bacterium]|nr:HAD hydrolase-like protein [Acidobacteriota bacterium]